VRADRAVYLADTRYVSDALRFDMGERDHFISMEMASIGMEMMVEWGQAAVAERLAMLTERIADGLRGTAVRLPDRRFRAPHILSLGLASGVEPGGLVGGLAGEGIHVAARLTRVRISPHVFNDEQDADRLVAALSRRLKG
jgi:selenocysteine lyase/cysteine desulfurase